MIEITREVTKVVLKVDVYPIGYIFHFSYDCQQEWAARALVKILREAFRDRVQTIRRRKYEAGLKDARGLKKDRKNWFETNLDL